MMFRTWKMVSGQVQGRAHQRRSLPCQDRTYTLSRRQTFVIALADGAGSYRRSDQGANLAVRATSRALVSQFDVLYSMHPQDVARSIVDVVMHRLTRATGPSDDVRELSSTLLFVAVKGERYLAGHLGDGVTGYYDGEACCVLSTPDNGEYTNLTYFTTDSDAVPRFRVYRGVLQEHRGFFLMSDGAASSLYAKKDRVFAPALNEIFQWLELYPSYKVARALGKNLQSVIRNRTHDDCSLALMRLCEFPESNVSSAPTAVLADFLGLQDEIGLRNRIAVWHLNRTGVPPADIANRLNLSMKAVNRHLFGVRRLQLPCVPRMDPCVYD